MKAITILILSVLLLSHPVFSQQEEQEKKNEFRLELLSFIGSTFYAEYERILDNNRGMNIVIAPTAIDNNEKQIFGMYVQVNPKFYYPAGSQGKSQHFLYFSPYAAYRYLDISDYYNDYYYPMGYGYPSTYVSITRTFLASSAGGGAMFGYKIVAGDFLILNFEAGGGIRYVFNRAGNSTYDMVNGGYNNWNLGYSGIYPRFNFTMGFKF